MEFFSIIFNFIRKYSLCNLSYIWSFSSTGIRDAKPPSTHEVKNLHKTFDSPKPYLLLAYCQPEALLIANWINPSFVCYMCCYKKVSWGKILLRKSYKEKIYYNEKNYSFMLIVPRKHSNKVFLFPILYLFVFSSIQRTLAPNNSNVFTHLLSPTIHVT